MEKILVEVRKIVDVQGLGLALGICMTAVEKIMEMGNPARQKRQIIFHWLRGKDIIKDRRGQVPTWNLLAEAVEEESPVISQSIRSKHYTKPV